ncbi:MAG: hypothetical protein DRI88_10780 [Bacteroidetes bacterium]|nr:MAG: hypothetical protein DRI88_10780 [Bacteroidota bacterium]
MFGSLAVSAQKKPLIEDRDKVAKRASETFKASMEAPEGELYLFGKENNITGSYDFKITLGDKGKVVSIFVLNREGGSIKMQNMVKDAVKETRFDFKLPKNKDYSITYKFNF